MIGFNVIVGNSGTIPLRRRISSKYSRIIRVGALKAHYKENQRRFQHLLMLLGATG